jgi:gamma-butyrobetaine dioxygenase
LPSIKTVEKDHVVLGFPGDNSKFVEATGKFHYVWLRDNCQCPQCVHPDSRQKLHSSGDINLDVKPKSIKVVPPESAGGSPMLQIEWPLGSLTKANSQPHTTEFDLKWLLESGHPRNPGLKALRTPPKATVSWDAKLYEANDNRVSYKDYMNTDEGLLRALRQLHDFGLCFLSGVPTANDKEVENVARRIGEIKETFYGVSWDVKSVPKAKNIAYTSLDLGLHMDLL